MDQSPPSMLRENEPAALTVPTAHPNELTGAVRSRMMDTRFDSVVALVVVDEAAVVLGVVRPEDLFAAPEQTPVGTLMDPEPPLVRPGEDEAAVAWVAVRHDQNSLVMVNDDGRLLGLVTPRQMMRALLTEHELDLSRFGGVLHDAESARAASYERVSRRLWHRLPWLLFGLMGALLSAVIVGGFEERLAGNLTLAFFVPAVVYMADAVGTQTETLVVRGLSVGVAIRPVLRREVMTGTAVGLLIAAISYPIIVLVWGDGGVAATVAVALFAACSTATIVAIVLPATLLRLGFDPAFGSGPLATVIQDLASIGIYFAVAAALAA